MSQLKSHEIEAMRDYLIEHGLSYEEVRDDVLDHLCCELEILLQEGKTFEEAFGEVRKEFDPKEIASIQSDTHYYLTIKNSLIMIKGIFISAYLAITCFVFSFAIQFLFSGVLPINDNYFLLIGLPNLFKFIGVSIFCFVFLPMLFFYGYKRFVGQLTA